MAWKDAPEAKALILLGARQTGKTYLVREFARQNYPSFIEVNFLEDKKAAAFLAGAESAIELVSRLSLVVGHEIEQGTLVFLDEVQVAKQIITLSKFLLDDGRFDLILSGSLLGTVLEGVASFPVGYAQIERMYPLDFEEFAWAMQVPFDILEQVRGHYAARTPLEESLHERFIKLYRQYIVVGGMPEAVQRFIDRRYDFGAARTVDREIIEQYRFDIAKYLPRRKLQIRAIFDNIPAQLAKENKRFIMKTIHEGATYERLEDDFVWLINAGVALPTYLVQEPRAPLLRTKVTQKFKLFSSDCGLLLAQNPAAVAMGILSGECDMNFGATYENAVAQELAAMGAGLYYYHNNRRGEVDFLFETSAGTVIPLEVKSGKDYKLHVALNNLLGSSGFDIPYAYVLSEHNLSVGEQAGKPVYYLPLYMTMCLAADCVDSLESLHAEP
ncbi:MAG: AAA family ATPase, partial [Coriobacteriales bacterium]|nr:AAA family ATPase [Coriobacteriales bacterium]